jgi:hypothetical protein
MNCEIPLRFIIATNPNAGRSRTIAKVLTARRIKRLLIGIERPETRPSPNPEE